MQQHIDTVGEFTPVGYTSSIRNENKKPIIILVILVVKNYLNILDLCSIFYNETRDFNGFFQVVW